MSNMNTREHIEDLEPKCNN